MGRANKVRRRKLVGGGESECVGRSMHMVGWLPKYLASPRLVMAHLGQYAPLLSVVANGACRQGAPLLTLCEVVTSQRGGTRTVMAHRANMRH